MTSNAAVLFTVMAAALCVGVAVFFRISARRSLRSAGARWLILTTVVLALGVMSGPLGLPPNGVIFTGLILPIWAVGGLLGLIIAAIRPGKPKQ